MKEATVRTRHCTAVLVGLGIAAGALAQDEESLNVDLADCVGLESEVARFACYERQVATALDDVEPAAEAAPAAQPAPAAQAAPPARAPQTAEASPIREPAAAEADPDEILATITEARETVPNTWIITLDNGQVWQQVQTKRYPVRVGVGVRLYPTRWGTSWRLTIPERGSFITVRRVD